MTAKTRSSSTCFIPRIALLICMAGGFFNSAMAVPADPVGREELQPDGTKIIVHVRGDEFFSWQETSDGYVVVKDPKDKYWKYAKPEPGKAKFRAIKGARVGKTSPKKLGLKKHDLPGKTVLKEHIQKKRDAICGKGKSDKSGGKSTTNQTTQANTQQSSQADEPPIEEPPDEEPPWPIPVSGIKTVKNLVILACFSNHWDSAGSTVLPAYGRVDTGEFDNLFNEVGHSSDGASGSVKDYYTEVSYGKLTVDSTVTVWVKLPREEAYYHNNQRVMAADAIEAADAAGVDFSLFDSDGDGWVDILDIIHSGYGEEATGDPTHVWSVKGAMSSIVTKDGVSMYNYHTEPALRGSSGTGIIRIGVICHETGHFFGLPDLYDYSSTIDGLGDWCLMSGGSWNGTSGTKPGHFSAWCKVFLGFARTVPVHSKTGLSLPNVEENPVVGMLRDGMNNDEYFLVENRAKIGFDNSGDIHPGLLIYHVDQRSANNDMGSWPHPAVKLEEADGNNDLSSAGDVWTSTSGLAGGFRDPTGNQSANAMLYQTGSLYNRTDNSASYTYNRINNFSAPGDTMTFDVQTLKTDAPTQSAIPATFNVAWAASSEATKYEIQEGSPATLTSFFDGAESADNLHDNWYVAGKTELTVTNESRTGSACYTMLQADYGKVQSITMRKPFKIKTDTVVSYYLMSHISTGKGYIKCQLSNDNGDTWKTLSNDAGYIDPWTLRSFNYTAISAAGISNGDTCLFRFLVDVERTSGWSSFPKWGFALDDISITGTEITGYDSWTTLDNNVTTTSYSISGKTAGTYAYRVQPYANSAWQGYGAIGETTVGANHAPAFNSDPITGDPASVGSAYSGTLSALAEDADVNDTLTFTKVSGPAWLSVASDGTMSGTPLPGDLGANTFTMRVADLASASDDAQVNIEVGIPQSGLNSDLVAYLPFDEDFEDYSGQGNNPSQSGSNSRSAGHIGDNAYVLTNSGYLSFGMDSDFRFPDTTEGNSTSFSISFWAKNPASGYTGEPPFIANKDWAADGNTGWALASGPPSGYFQMNFKERNANLRHYDSATPPGSDWHHYLVVFKRDATRTCITYIDGSQADSRTMYASGVDIDDANLPVNIGQDGTGTGTRGTWSGALMDDFAFWRRELSSTEASAIYEAGTNGIAMAYAQASPVITNLTASLTLPYNASTNLSVDVISVDTPNYQWRLGGSPISGATSSMLAITNNTSPATNRYDVIVNNSHGSTTSEVVVVTMHGAPVVGGVTVTRETNTVLKVTGATLLANSSDPEGSALSVVWVSPASTNGGTVTLSGQWVTYTATAGYNSTDAFTFRVQNAYGNTTDGTATVQMDTSGNQGSDLNIAMSAVTSSNVLVRIVGIPGRTFDVQHATTLSPPDWSTIGSSTVGSLGFSVFTNAPPPAGSTHFFRTIEQE